MHINENIKRFRGLTELTQEQVAQKIGVKRTTFAEWEKETPPSSEYLSALASVLRVTVDEILELPKNGQVKLDVGRKVSQKPAHTTAAHVDISMSGIIALINSNKELTESNLILTKMLQAKTAVPQEIPADVESRFADLLELIAKVGSGKRWKSEQEASAALSNEFYGVQKKAQKKDTQIGSGK